MMAHLNNHLASLGVLLFALWVTGCYTERILTTDDFAEHEGPIIVFTDGPICYELEEWIAERDGTIRGSGTKVYQDDHWWSSSPVRRRSRFTGTIPSSEIKRISVEQLDKQATIGCIALGAIGLTLLIWGISALESLSGSGYGLH